VLDRENVQARRGGGVKGEGGGGKKGNWGMKVGGLAYDGAKNQGVMKRGGGCGGHVKKKGRKKEKKEKERKRKIELLHVKRCAAVCATGLLSSPLVPPPLSILK